MLQKKQEESKSLGIVNLRRTELDLLRILACFLVVISHLTCLVVFNLDFEQWNFANILYVARDSCVPLFYCISGIFYLDPGKSIHYRKIGVSIVKYTLLYILTGTVLWFFRDFSDGADMALLLVSACKKSILEPIGHLWFLPSIIGIYLCIPICRIIIKSRKVLQYYLILWLIFAITKPTVLMVLNEVQFVKVRNVEVLVGFINSFTVAEFCGYLGYFLLGCWLYHFYQKKSRICILAAVYGAGIVIPVIMNMLHIKYYQSALVSTYDYFSVFAFLQTTCLILFFKDYISKIQWNGRAVAMISIVAAQTFGVYLIHPFFTERAIYNVIERNILISIPGYAVFIFLLCFLIVMVKNLFLRVVRLIFEGCGRMKEDKKYFIFIGILLGRLLVYTFFLSGLYADGSYALLEVLKRGDLFLWYRPRNMSMAFSRCFVWVAMKLGCNSFRFLTICYSFGCNLWITVFIILSIFICRRYRSRRLLDVSVVMWSMILAFTGLYCMHESLFTIAFIWLLFVFIYHMDRMEKEYKHRCFLLLMLLAALGGTYESFGIFGFVLIILFLAKIGACEKKFTLYHISFFMLLLANTIIELYYILQPLNQDSQNGYLQQLINTDKSMLGLLFVMIVYFVATEWFYFKKYKNIYLIIEICIGILTFIYMVLDIEKVVFYTRTVRGVFHLLVPLVIMVLFSLRSLCGNIGQDRVNTMARMSWILLIGSAITIYMTAYGYQKYLKNMARITVQNEGFIIWPMEGDREIYTTDWTIPFESVIAQVIYQDIREIRSIIVQKPETIYFQPFDMWNIDAYYELGKYGISYKEHYFKN